jgi:hypothetical protein
MSCALTNRARDLGSGIDTWTDPMQDACDCLRQPSCADTQVFAPPPEITAEFWVMEAARSWSNVVTPKVCALMPRIEVPRVGGGASRRAPARRPRTYGYCADRATSAVSMRNLETATCAGVANSAIVESSATDGSARPSAVA